MKKIKKLEDIDGEFPLPEVIIQHIQSFLDGKHAAQTSILSKSWRDAWLTSPNLDFDERDFESPGQFADCLAEFATKTLQRYQRSNLKIAKFRLWMKSTQDERSSLLAYGLTAEALKLGAHNLDLEFFPPSETFVLPGVVLGAETLTRLSLTGCKIDPPDSGKVSCSRLKFLSLRRVYIGDDLFWDMMSSCPLIEDLVLSECECVIDLKTSSVARMMIKVLALRCPVMKPIEFSNLKFLTLDGLDIDGVFMDDSCLKFPCLIELNLSRCYGYRGVHVSGPSIERISLETMRMFRAKFGVPNIRKFKFSGPSLPFLSFSTVSSSEWVSEIRLKCSNQYLVASWFIKLNRFLTNLSPSKISLTILLSSNMNIRPVGGVGFLPRPMVDNLSMFVSPLCSAESHRLLGGLFWSCRPKLITLYWFPRSCSSESANNQFVELLCKTLIQGGGQGCSVLPSLFELEETCLEIFEEASDEWRTLPDKELSDGSSPETRQKIRFRLGWGEEPCTSM